MYQLQQTDVFASWLVGLRDVKAQARILARLESARLGNLGDCKAIGSGIREMRIHTGSGLSRVLRAEEASDLATVVRRVKV